MKLVNATEEVKVEGEDDIKFKKRAKKKKSLRKTAVIPNKHDKNLSMAQPGG